MAAMPTWSPYHEPTSQLPGQQPEAQRVHNLPRVTQGGSGAGPQGPSRTPPLPREAYAFSLLLDEVFRKKQNPGSEVPCGCAAHEEKAEGSEVCAPSKSRPRPGARSWYARSPPEAQQTRTLHSDPGTGSRGITRNHMRNRDVKGRRTGGQREWRGGGRSQVRCSRIPLRPPSDILLRVSVPTSFFNL